MFLENTLNHLHKEGSIEVVCGSMFSGKTEELIRRLKRAKFAKQNVQIFKPAVDKRYHDIEVVSHNATSIEAMPVESAQQILLLASEADVVGIDEAQFFDTEIVAVCNELANQGTRVIVAGLDMDFLGKPFGPMPQLMAISNQVTKVHAICVRCGELALFSHRTSTSEALVLLGETDLYEPLCRTHYLESIKRIS